MKGNSIASERFEFLLFASFIFILLFNNFIFHKLTSNEKTYAPSTVTKTKIEGENKFDVTETFLMQILNAQRVFLHTNPVLKDIDDDGSVESVVIATVVGNQRPENAVGKFQVSGSDVSSDLMILKVGSLTEKTQILAYYIEPFGATNGPYLILKDLNNDRISEIIISSNDPGENFWLNISKIVQYKNSQFEDVVFEKGEFDKRNTVEGMLDFTQTKDNILRISYSEDGGISDTYEWKDGTYRFVSTTARNPSVSHLKVLRYLKSHMNDLVKEKSPQGLEYGGGGTVQFFSLNRFITGFSEGHILGYMIGEYNIDGEAVKIKVLDEFYNRGIVDELRVKYGFDTKTMDNYTSSRDMNFEWKWTPVDLFDFENEN